MSSYQLVRFAVFALAVCTSLVSAAPAKRNRAQASPVDSTGHLHAAERSAEETSEQALAALKASHEALITSSAATGNRVFIRSEETAENILDATVCEDPLPGADELCAFKHGAELPESMMDNTTCLSGSTLTADGQYCEWTLEDFQQVLFDGGVRTFCDSSDCRRLRRSSLRELWS